MYLDLNKNICMSNICSICRRRRLQNIKNRNQVLSEVDDSGGREKTKESSCVKIECYEEEFRGSMTTQKCEGHDSTNGK